MIANPNATQQAMAATELLKRAFPGRVITTDDTSEHKTELSRPWSQTCWVPAAAYVRPNTSEEVAEALKIITQTGSKFAVRTTGHNPNLGFSSTDETGIVIDLRNLDSKSVDSDGILRAGAGNTWGVVYSWLEDRKLSAMGGRDADVGLGGFLLGGGLGPFPSLHGIGADTVKNFEVVLANGTIVNANADTNVNLFRALKGGGSNFGIVTRFDIATYPLMNIQYTINAYDAADYINILKATVQVQEAMESDPKIGLFTNVRNGFLIVGLMYADCPAETPKAFDPFLKLTSLVNVILPTTNGTFSALVKTLGQFHPPVPQKRAVCTATTKASYDLYAGIYGAWKDEIKNLVAGVDLHFTIQPITSSCVQAGEASGGNTMGLQKVPQCWFVFTAEWETDGHDAAIEETLTTIMKQAKKLAAERELLLSYLSMTFAHSSQNVLQSYGAENVKKLRDTADKYDPKGLFQAQQNAGFLLRNLQAAE